MFSIYQIGHKILIQSGKMFFSKANTWSTKSQSSDGLKVTLVKKRNFQPEQVVDDQSATEKKQLKLNVRPRWTIKNNKDPCKLVIKRRKTIEQSRSSIERPSTGEPSLKVRLIAFEKAEKETESTFRRVKDWCKEQTSTSLPSVGFDLFLASDSPSLQTSPKFSGLESCLSPELFHLQPSPKDSGIDVSSPPRRFDEIHTNDGNSVLTATLPDVTILTPTIKTISDEEITRQEGRICVKDISKLEQKLSTSKVLGHCDSKVIQSHFEQTSESSAASEKSRLLLKLSFSALAGYESVNITQVCRSTPVYVNAKNKTGSEVCSAVRCQNETGQSIAAKNGIVSHHGLTADARMTNKNQDDPVISSDIRHNNQMDKCETKDMSFRTKVINPDVKVQKNSKDENRSSISQVLMKDEILLKNTPKNTKKLTSFSNATKRNGRNQTGPTVCRRINTRNQPIPAINTECSKDSVVEQNTKEVSNTIVSKVVTHKLRTSSVLNMGTINRSQSLSTVDLKTNCENQISTVVASENRTMDVADAVFDLELSRRNKDGVDSGCHTEEWNNATADVGRSAKNWTFVKTEDQSGNTVLMTERTEDSTDVAFDIELGAMVPALVTAYSKVNLKDQNSSAISTKTTIINQAGTVAVKEMKLSNLDYPAAVTKMSFKDKLCSSLTNEFSELQPARVKKTRNKIILNQESECKNNVANSFEKKYGNIKRNSSTSQVKKRHAGSRNSVSRRSYERLCHSKEYPSVESWRDNGVDYLNFDLALKEASKDLIDSGKSNACFNCVENLCDEDQVKHSTLAKYFRNEQQVPSDSNFTYTGQDLQLSSPSNNRLNYICPKETNLELKGKSLCQSLKYSPRMEKSQRGVKPSLDSQLSSYGQQECKTAVDILPNTSVDRLNSSSQRSIPSSKIDLKPEFCNKFASHFISSCDFTSIAKTCRNNAETDQKSKFFIKSTNNYMSEFAKFVNVKQLNEQNNYAYITKDGDEQISDTKAKENEVSASDIEYFKMQTQPCKFSPSHSSRNCLNSGSSGVSLDFLKNSPDLSESLILTRSKGGASSVLSDCSTLTNFNDLTDCMSVKSNSSYRNEDSEGIENEIMHLSKSQAVTHHKPCSEAQCICSDNSFEVKNFDVSSSICKHMELTCLQDKVAVLLRTVFPDVWQLYEKQNPLGLPQFLEQVLNAVLCLSDSEIELQECHCDCKVSLCQKPLECLKAFKRKTLKLLHVLLPAADFEGFQTSDIELLVEAVTMANSIKLGDEHLCNEDDEPKLCGENCHGSLNCNRGLDNSINVECSNSEDLPLLKADDSFLYR